MLFSGKKPPAAVQNTAVSPLAGVGGRLEACLLFSVAPAQRRAKVREFP
jgi:hypothetical protein